MQVDGLNQPELLTIPVPCNPKPVAAGPMLKTKDGAPASNTRAPALLPAAVDIVVFKAAGPNRSSVIVELGTAAGLQLEAVW